MTLAAMLLPLSVFLSASVSLTISSIFLHNHDNSQLVILWGLLSPFPHEFALNQDIQRVISEKFPNDKRAGVSQQGVLVPTPQVAFVYQDIHGTVLYIL